MPATVASAMCANPTTTIQISVQTWKDLNARKEPSDTFDDVIQDLLQDDSHDSPTETIAATEPQSDTATVTVPESVPDRFDEREIRELITAAIDFVKGKDGAPMREIVTTVGQEHPLDYDPPESLEKGERYRSAYWRKILKPALESSDEIRKPKPHESEWQPV